VADAARVVHRASSFRRQFFKMLKVGVPRGGVKQKMRQEGLNPAILDMDPTKPPPATAPDDAAAQPALKDHPKYAKVRVLFRPVLEVGVPPYTLWCGTSSFAC